jgi:hypothetical protein
MCGDVESRSLRKHAVLRQFSDDDDDDKMGDDGNENGMDVVRLAPKMKYDCESILGLFVCFMLFIC